MLDFKGIEKYENQLDREEYKLLSLIFIFLPMRY